MARRPKPEAIVAEPRQVDVLVAQGRTVTDAVRSSGIDELDLRPDEGVIVRLA